MTVALRTYTWAEIDGLLARGDVAGKLIREDLPTPALLVDLDSLEANIAKMADFCRQKRRALDLTVRLTNARRSPMHYYEPTQWDVARRESARRRSLRKPESPVCWSQPQSLDAIRSSAQSGSPRSTRIPSSRWTTLRMFKT